jgi:hypothetical protein
MTLRMRSPLDVVLVTRGHHRPHIRVESIQVQAQAGCADFSFGAAEWRQVVSHSS